MLKSSSQLTLPFFTYPIPISMVLCLAISCGSEAETTPNAPTHTIPGIFADKLGEIMPRATDAQKEAFARGLTAGLDRFSPQQGLGPAFNVTFCLSCHENPLPGGSGAHYRDFLLTRRVEGPLTFDTGLNGAQQHYSVAAQRRMPTHEGTNTIATRNPIPFFGVGLFSLVSAEEILSRADATDADGDGISGRVNFANGLVGRFGRKAQTASLEGFVRGPLLTHLGITSDPLSVLGSERTDSIPLARPGAMDTAAAGDTLGIPEEDRGEVAKATRKHRGTTTSQARTRANQAGAPDAPTEDEDDIADPEIPTETLFDLVTFAAYLAAPKPDEPTAYTQGGEEIFTRIACTGCHVPKLQTPIGQIPAYTDLLIHDMGPVLDDGIIMGGARGAEFRTAPLWGVVATGPYLHDGRADNLDEAIRYHGGEAEASKIAYESLQEEERQQLRAFLQSLGGRQENSRGLIRTDEIDPATDTLGGPVSGLSQAEIEQHKRGRVLFDEDFGYGRGLGPGFNGDSCRACHFDPLDGNASPAVGGAGPLGVNVIRQAIREGSTVTLPEGGSFLHRFFADGTRPEPAAESNFFEARQTPPIFGLGLIEQIPESAIRAQEATACVNGQPCGRAHTLASGKLGRFGWKADIPDLAEFARDALSMEMGITVPEQMGRTFGFSTDTDSSPDPEVSEQELEDLIFFLRTLAAPPRRSVDAAAEMRGEQLFGNTGCAGCHTPELPTLDANQPAKLFSDLLLHDVMESDGVGVPAGDATGREFRTPPLWGLAHSAPYMHDGMAHNIESAIAAHAGEALSSRQAYEQLTPEQRQDLLMFLQSL